MKLRDKLSLTIHEKLSMIAESYFSLGEQGIINSFVECGLMPPKRISRNNWKAHARLVVDHLFSGGYHSTLDQRRGKWKNDKKKREITRQQEQLKLFENSTVEVYKMEMNQVLLGPAGLPDKAKRKDRGLDGVKMTSFLKKLV